MWREPFSKALWAELSSQERVTLACVATVVALLPVALGGLVAAACPMCGSDREQQDTRCPVSPSGSFQSGFFQSVWVLIYLRFGVVMARYVIGTYSVMRAMPNEQRNSLAHANSPLPTILGTGFLMLLSLALNYLWVVFYSCMGDPHQARNVLISLLGTNIALALLILQLDRFAAASQGVYIAYLVYALILNHDTIAKGPEPEPGTQVQAVYTF